MTRDSTSLADAYAAALRGDFAIASESVALDAGAESEAQAWKLAIDAASWLVGSTSCKLPDLESIARHARHSEKTRAISALACGHLLRSETLAFSRNGVEQTLRTLREIVDPEDAEGQATLELGRSWAKLAAGEIAGLSDALRDIERGALSRKLARVVVEAAILRALCLLAENDSTRGLDEARRAARMARTEAIFELDLLSALVLCRARRLTGRSHLAASIASAALRFAPAPWKPWLEWELVLSGSNAPISPGDGIPGLLRETLRAANTGNREAWVALRDRLKSATESWFPFRLDTDVLVGAIEVGGLERGLPDALVRWKRGETDETPFGITALCTSATDEVDDGASAVAWVVAIPDQPAERVIRPGAALVCSEPGAHRIPQLQRKQGRSDSTLAALFLAGVNGLAEEQLFQKVYGFTYRPTLHKDVLKLLLHRLKPRLGALAALVREGARVTLTPKALLVVADPRCSRPLDERVLALLASRNGLSAKDAANELGLPLRTAQAALEELVTEGVCRTERSGRSIEYRVDDTTFEIPTRYRSDHSN